VLAILVIVFAWLSYSWSKYVLTILGALLAILALVGTCCCSTMLEKAKPETPSEAGQ
jgi:MFS-type transporter involved in bile tolerance (Atg22 family)